MEIIICCALLAEERLAMLARVWVNAHIHTKPAMMTINVRPRRRRRCHKCTKFGGIKHIVKWRKQFSFVWYGRHLYYTFVGCVRFSNCIWEYGNMEYGLVGGWSWCVHIFIRQHCRRFSAGCFFVVVVVARLFLSQHHWKMWSEFKRNCRFACNGSNGRGRSADVNGSCRRSYCIQSLIHLFLAFYSLSNWITYFIDVYLLSLSLYI